MVFGLLMRRSLALCQLSACYYPHGTLVESELEATASSCILFHLGLAKPPVMPTSYLCIRLCLNTHVLRAYKPVGRNSNQNLETKRNWTAPH